MTTETEKDPIDVHVGMRLKEVREARGLSQAQLAEAIKVSFQQVQKYERGINRLSASRLYAAAGFLDVAIGELFPHRGRTATGEPSSAETWAVAKVQTFLASCEADTVFQVFASKAPGLLILSMISTGHYEGPNPAVEELEAQ